MKSRLAFPLALLLAACGGNGGGNSSEPAAPVAAVKPPAGQDWTQTVSVTPEGGFVMGNPNAPIKLVEYGARTCPTCGAFSKEAAEPLARDYVATGKVSFEFRDYLVHGSQDLAAALLGQCGGPGAFFPILDQMYASQEQWLNKLFAAAQGDPSFEGRLQAQTPAQQMATLADTMGLVDFVKQRGVPEPRARACLADTTKMDQLAKATQEATQSGRVTGTPTFYLNGERIENAVSWPQVRDALERAGA